MMAPDSPKENHDYPADRFPSPLDALVEKVAAAEPPEDVVERSMERARAAIPVPGNRRGLRIHRRLAAALAIATAAGLAGASLVWWIMEKDGQGIKVVEEREPGPADSPRHTPDEYPDIDANPPAPSPTFWVYHQAARRSPEDLESLLDEHAQQYAFGPASNGLGDLLGFNEETL